MCSFLPDRAEFPKEVKKLFCSDVVANPNFQLVSTIGGHTFLIAIYLRACSGGLQRKSDVPEVLDEKNAAGRKGASVQPESNVK